MAYDYQALRKELFTDAGQRMFLHIRDSVNAKLDSTGAVRMQEATAGATGDSWLQLVCVDRMVELKEIREIVQNSCAGQHRIFVRPYTN